MTPFDLDSLINPLSKDPKKKESLVDLKRKQDLMGDFYEDDENDFGSRLYDKDFD